MMSCKKRSRIYISDSDDEIEKSESCNKRSRNSVSDSDDDEIEKYDDLPWPDSPNNVNYVIIHDLTLKNLKQIFCYVSRMDNAWTIPLVCKKWRDISKDIHIEKFTINGNILHDNDHYAFENETRKYDWMSSLFFFKKIEVLQIDCLKKIIIPF